MSSSEEATLKEKKYHNCIKLLYYCFFRYSLRESAEAINTEEKKAQVLYVQHMDNINLIVNIIILILS